MIRSLVTTIALASTTSALAQVPPSNSAPQPTPIVETIPAPRDILYPGGTILLDVDATDTERGIFRVKESVPVAASGPMVLLYPKWLPGNHSPTGQIDKLAGLVIRANGTVLPWTRDRIDVFAFHVDVPQGARMLEVEFQFLSATKPDQGRVAMTPNLISLQPNSVSLYPAGYYTRQIPIQMTVHYPQGFTAAGAIPAEVQGTTYAYQKTNYEILVDSPILAGRYGKTWQLSPRVDLNVFADNASMLKATPEQIDAHRKLVDQAVKLFGAQHYDHYEFLLSLSDQLGSIGLEHHRSSENGSRVGYFTEWDQNAPTRNLLPHEFSHSWDGKFRRGAELWTPDFRTPMQGESLWVYEGQTQFWGYVLQARSGLVSKQDTLDGYAALLGTYDTAPARQWRPLIDTTNDPVMSQRRPKGWVSWQRSEDYYNEGLMVWMEVDALLRQKSNGRKSLDDFARPFFGIRDGDWGEVTYRFGDVADTLNRIVPYDWAGFLQQRLTETGKAAPLQGFILNGYRLVYVPEQSSFLKQNEKARKISDFSYSLGLVVGDGNTVTATIWNSLAFQAGIDVGSQIQAVDDEAYSADVMKAAIVAAKDRKEPIRLIIRNGDRFRTVSIDYHGGPRYPKLEKIGAGKTGLDRLLEAR
jgi:predicted metalloprotease with PDZ domain